jgi:integrase
MRSGDILRLRWNNIQQDFRNKCQTLNFVPHKTAHHNKRREVFFPITGELAEVLSTWREQQKNPEAGLIFPSTKTGVLMDKNAYHRHWTTVKALGELSEDLQFYALRHNFITERVNAGWPLLAIAKLVGHADTSMIAENYFNPDADNLAALMMSMEQIKPTAQEASA